MSWSSDRTTKRGGIVSAAPGDAGWFHGHFGVSEEPLRVLAFLGGYPRRVKGIPGVDWRGLNLDVKQGGDTIEYRDEDPHIRKMFQEQLAKEGADFNMRSTKLIGKQFQTCRLSRCALEQ